MALKQKTLKKVALITRIFINFLKYRSVGPHALTQKELKDLVRYGLITSGKAPKTAVARSYLTTHENVAVTPAPKTARDGAIDFLERMFTRYSDKLGEAMSADILGQIEGQLMPFVDRREGKEIYDLLRDKDVHSKYLGAALKNKVSNWQNRWKLIVNTELGRASQYGAMDAILHNNKDKAPEDILVYKVGPHDGATCKWCTKFWFTEDGITPRVYKMSELAANGTNIGRKQADWKPTVDSTHPNERHLLQELRPGFGFKNGKLEYIGKDHDEYATQRNKK